MGFREILLFLRSSGSLRERFWCWCCCCCCWWSRWCWWCWCWWCCWCFCWNSCCWMWCGRKWDFPQSKESSENLSFQAKKETFRKMEMQKRLKGQWRQWPNFKQAVRIFFLVPCYNACLWTSKCPFVFIKPEIKALQFSIRHCCVKSLLFKSLNEWTKALDAIKISLSQNMVP